MAKSLFHKGPFRPIQLRKNDDRLAKRLLQFFGRPIVSEFVLLVVALGAVYAFAFVFLDFRVSIYMTLLGL